MGFLFDVCYKVLLQAKGNLILIWQLLCFLSVSAKPKEKTSLRDFREILQEVKPTMMNQFLQEEEGQTLVEYGLLISLIALVVIAVLTLLGGKIKGVFGTASNSIKTTT